MQEVISEFAVRVVRMGKVGKHPNADNLSIAHIYGYPVIFLTGAHKEGDLVVYVPVDAVLPEGDPRWSHVKGKSRIRAIRLRNIFSMGVLTHADPDWIEHQDVQNELNIKKYEAPIDIKIQLGCNQKDPGFMPVYGIHALRRYPDILKEGEEVVIMEKIHGANMRCCFHKDQFWVGSHTCIKKNDGESLWSKLASSLSLEEKLKNYPGIVVYGEAYGWVQNLRYAANKNEYFFCMFDAFNIETRKYFDFDDLEKFSKELNIPLAPVLYKGPWNENLKELAQGNTTINGINQIKEGIVIRAAKENFDPKIGRKILKLHGEQYLLSKYC